MAQISTKKDYFTPSKQQLTFLKAYLFQDIRSTIDSICKDAGVPRRTYYNWKNDGRFNEWFENQIRQNVNRFTPSVMINLFKKASSPEATSSLIELALSIARLMPDDQRKNEEVKQSDLNDLAEKALKELSTEELIKELSQKLPGRR